MEVCLITAEILLMVKILQHLHASRAEALSQWKCVSAHSKKFADGKELFLA